MRLFEVVNSLFPGITTTCTTNFTRVTHLKALYAEQAEVLVQFSPCLLRLAEVFFQMYLHLLSAA